METTFKRCEGCGFVVMTNAPDRRCRDCGAILLISWGCPTCLHRATDCGRNIPEPERAPLPLSQGDFMKERRDEQARLKESFSQEERELLLRLKPRL